MKVCSLLMVLLLAVTASAVEIQPRIVRPPHVCRDTCCDRPGNWHREWAIYHPAKLAVVPGPLRGEAIGEDPQPASWVVKREKACCLHPRYDTYAVEGGQTVFEGTFDHYRVRADSPRVPPILAYYWPNRQMPAWFIEGDYFYFVRIDPADPTRQCSWWISADAQQWELLEAGQLVSDPQRLDAVGGPPQLPLPWVVPPVRGE